MVLNITGYSPSPNLLNGSPHDQAVANGNASIEAAAQRNSAGGKRKRKRKTKKYGYKGGAGVLEVNTIGSNKVPRAIILAPLQIIKVPFPFPLITVPASIVNVALLVTYT